MYRIKIIVISTILLCLLQRQALAQEDDSVKTAYKSVSGFYLGIAGRFMDVSALNDNLIRNGLAPLESGIVGFSLGFTGRRPTQNSYASFELSYLGTADDGTRSSLESKLELFQLSITGHYDVIANESWLLYPYLSIGWDWGKLTVSQIYGDSTFNSSLSTLNDPEVVQNKYHAVAPKLELGLGVERRIRLPMTDLFVGISGGYTLSPRSYWTLKAVKSYSDSPTLNNTGWGFKLFFRVEPNNVKPKKEPWSLYRFFK